MNSENLSTFANYELGEAFFQLISKMVVRDGIPFSKIGDFDIVSKEWRKLADKPNKTPEEIKKIDTDYKIEIRDLADSCMIYMGAKTGNKTYKFTFEEYKKFMEMIDAVNGVVQRNAQAQNEYIEKLKIQFTKIANHGEATGDNLIDRKDFAAYIYTLDMKSSHDENNKFTGFYLNGKITPLDCAVVYRQLKEKDDNLTTLKLRHAYKNLYTL